MATYEITSPDGQKFLATAPDDVTQDEVMKYAQKNFKLAAAPAKQEKSVLDSVVSSVGDNLNSIPRQLGLTARYGLEGVGTALNTVTEPLRYLTDAVTPNRATTLSNLVTGQKPPKSVPVSVLASTLADTIGLPKPASPTERVIGEASKLLAGTAATGGASLFAADKLTGIPQAVAQGLAASPTAQGTAAVGAGLAGGASKETGGSPLMQFGSAVLGGVGGGFLGGGAASIGNRVSNAYDVVKTAIKNMEMPSTQTLDAQISLILQRAGVDYSQIPERARQAMRDQIASALKTGGEIDPAAVARLADFARVGATPTRGMVSQNPIQITQEQNLAKTAANSTDASLHGLPLIFNQNNTKLISGVNNLGATNGNPLAAGAGAINAITAKDAALGSGVTALYNDARKMSGGDIPIARAPFLDAIFSNLAKENKLAFLPESIGNMLNTISSGVIKVNGQTHEVPFTAQTIDNIKTMIATAQRGTSDGNVKAALKIAREAIDSVPLAPVKNVAGGNQVVTAGAGQSMNAADGSSAAFMEALNKARAAAASRFAWQESGAPIEAALGGVAPDKFIQKYVIGGNVRDLESLKDNVPLDGIKNAVLAHLKDKALNGAADEVGKFSQSSYNKALRDIGDAKLSLLFSPEELAQLRSIGRVASYMQVQPVGSAVNNSNSAAMIVGKAYDAIKGAAGIIPGVGPIGAGILDLTIGQPVKGAANWLNQRAAQNVVPGLLATQPRSALPGALVAPGLAAAGGGLLTLQ